MAEWLSGLDAPSTVGIAAAGVLLLVVLVWIWRKRRRQPSIADALAAVAVDHLEDIVVPDGLGGEIHLEHLLLTSNGILVVNVKNYEGAIFAGERMDQWTAIGSVGRSTFQNPLPNLHDRVHAVRQLVRDVDVRGLVIFPSTADFSKGRPDEVMLPDDLRTAYAKPDQSDLGRRIEAFGPHWDKIRAAVQPAST
ncbi:MAG: nuclease-related domain-containing protein [Gammaproteobacteria bacterium]|jgi:hypothetical protein